VFAQKYQHLTALALCGIVSVCVTSAGCSSKASDCETTRSCAPAADGGEASPGPGDGEAGANQAAGGSASAGGADEGGSAPDESGNCERGLTACAARCVDTASNANHCGSCGHACAVGSVCAESECVACAGDRVACNGSCIDPQSDAQFCGASADCDAENRGVACGASEACYGGECVSDDASLQALSLAPANLTPSFSSEKLAYTASFSYFESHLELQAAPTSSAASMSYADADFSKDDSVSIVTTPQDELEQVTVEVTAASGKHQSYDVELQRRPLLTTRAKASSSRAGFRFGYSVALSGDTAVFGAPDEDGSAVGVDGDETTTGVTGAGAAYVAVRDADGHWSRQAYLKPDVVEEGAQFGKAVAIDGDTIVVGAPNEHEAWGAIYVFMRQGTKWFQQDRKREIDPNPGSRFGSAVVLEGDRIAVGAPGSSRFIGGGGMVYTYARVGDTWKLDIPARPPFVATDAAFGHSLAMNGGRLAVSQQTGDSSVAVRKLVDGTSTTKWTADGVIALPIGTTNAKVALEGDTVATATGGVVRLFNHVDGVWIETASVKPFVAAAATGFGASIAMRGDLLVVGSACEDCKGGFSTFVRDGDSWLDGSYVTADDLDNGDGLGYAVAVSGNRVVAGAPGEDSSAKSFEQAGSDNGSENSGAAFLFE
jgi:hypothetical protein